MVPGTEQAPANVPDFFIIFPNGKMYLYGECLPNQMFTADEEEMGPAEAARVCGRRG